MLLAISIAVAIIFFVAFIVSVKSGQYDDSYTPSVRMLFEDELVKPDRQDKPLNTKIKGKYLEEFRSNRKSIQLKETNR